MDSYYTFIIKTSVLCAVTVDGKYLGECRDRPMAVRAKKKQSYFIKAVFYCGLGKRYKDISAIFCPENRTGFEGADIVRYSTGTFLLQLYAVPEANTGVFEPVEQVMFEQSGLLHTATLYTDGISFIKLESADSVAKKRLSGVAGEFSLTTLKLGADSLLVVSGKTDKAGILYILGYDGEDYTFKVINNADNFSVENDLLIVNGTLYTIRRHTLTRQYKYTGKKLAQSESTKSTPQKPLPWDCRLLPYAFLESVMAESADEALSMLDSSHYEGTEFIQLQNYLGEYSSVVQNPYDKELHSYAGTVYLAGHRYYEINYYSFDITGGKIRNITKK